MSAHRPPDNTIANAQLVQGLGRVQQLYSTGYVADAERLCRELVAAHPTAPGALNGLALILKGKGQLDEAETMMRRALAAMPREAALHNNLGNLLRQKGELPGAETAYRQALALKRDYPEAYYNLGIVLQDTGRSEEALAAQRRAVALRPAYTDALTQIGVLLIAKADLNGALEALDAAVRSDPRHFPAIYHRGLVLYDLQRYDDAINAQRQALVLRPDSYEAFYALGNALAAAQREEQALEVYRKVIDLAPDFLPGHYDFSSLAWTMGREDVAFTSYAVARSRIGETPDLLLAEAMQRLRLKDAPAAEDLARRAQAVAPERLDVTNLLAQTLTMQKRFDESIALLQAAVRAEPEQILHHRELGVAYLHDRQPDAARRVLEQAQRLAPADQLILAYLTLAYRELDDERQRSLADVEKYVRAYDVPPPEGLDVEAFNQALTEELQRLHTRRVEPLDQTLRGGTQTMGHLFTRDIAAIADFRERIRAVVADYVRTLPDDPNHPFLSRKSNDIDFAGSWSCRLRSSGFHTNHVHPEGWISSAYYVSLPGVVAKGTDEQGWLKFGESNIELGERDRPVRTVQPAVGKLVLFPSYFWHGTVPFTDEAARLTVAFDVTPRP